MLFQRLQTKLFLTLVMFVSGSTYAGVVINNTRVVFPGNEKEVTVQLTNAGKKPVLVQSWIDTGDDNAKPETIKVPFILTPPVNRLNENKSQTLRIRSIKPSNLPEDKESVFWLNVLEVPSVKEDTLPNRLQVAVRHRIKLFYRPQAINDINQVTNAAEKLQWQVSGNKLIAINNSPYFISLASITAITDGKNSSIEGEMVEPKSQKEFALGKLNTIQNIDFEYINDWGALKKHKFTFN